LFSSLLFCHLLFITFSFNFTLRENLKVFLVDENGVFWFVFLLTNNSLAAALFLIALVRDLEELYLMPFL
jgi:hypothetical protein